MYLHARLLMIARTFCAAASDATSGSGKIDDFEAGRDTTRENGDDVFFESSSRFFSKAGADFQDRALTNGRPPGAS
jgi:hypothetical protein